MWQFVVHFRFYNKKTIFMFFRGTETAKDCAKNTVRWKWIVVKFYKIFYEN